MERVKRSDLDSALARLCGELGTRVAKSYNDIGAWRIDKAYGGYTIEVIDNQSGGVHQFNYRRRTARELFDCLNFTLDVLREASRKLKA
jgi:hypothetical protein